MASNYWIKLYHEILDDPKMMRMSEVLFSRCIKLFLLAGDIGDEGRLPSPEDAAWRLRIGEEEMESDYIELQKLGVLGQTDGNWFVSKWQERQGPMSSAERTRRYRENQQSLEYEQDGPADVRFEGRDRDETETKLKRNVTQIRKEKIKNRKEIDKTAEAAVELISYFCKISNIPKPRNRKEQVQWEDAAMEIVSIASGVDDARRRTKDAFEKLRDNNLIISGPQSLVKTIRGSTAYRQESSTRAFLAELEAKADAEN